MKKRERSNFFILNTLNIPLFSDIYEFSRLTSLSTRLIYVLSQKSTKYYIKYTIPKRSGDTREINAPKYSMKTVQRWILQNILDKVYPFERAMAFRKGAIYGCIPNANYHKYSIYTVSIDLSNFFTSITGKMVFQLFKDIGYNDFASTLLSNICTLDGVLPQGGVCSLALSNLICRRLDGRLSGLCEKRGIVYTRYADDMCFSCDNKDLLNKTLPIIRYIIIDEKFEINEKKTKFSTPSNRKMITGIVISAERDLVGRKLKAPRDKKMEVRESIHRAIVSGDYSEKDRILGLISYIDYVERIPQSNYISYKEKIKEYIKKCSGKIALYSEVVAKYNENLFFPDLPQINCSNCLQVDEEDEWDEICNQIEEREKYFTKTNIVDICNYKENFGFDDSVEINVGTNDECDIPF